MLPQFNDTTPYTKLYYHNRVSLGYGAAHTLSEKDTYFLKRDGKMQSVSHDVFYLRVFLREIY
jgi:hypothetical protein